MALLLFGALHSALFLPHLPVGGSIFSFHFLSSDISDHLLVPLPDSRSSQVNPWFLTPSVSCWKGCLLPCQSPTATSVGAFSSLAVYSGWPLELGPSLCSLGSSMIHDYVPNQPVPCTPPGVPGSCPIEVQNQMCNTLFLLLWGGQVCQPEGSAGTQGAPEG